MKSGPLRSPRPLRPLRFSPRKRFGQHFLESAWVDKLIRVIDPRPDEEFLEIGPGRGALTDLLSQRARRVIAIELDRDLVPYLRDRYREAGNVDVIERDVLEVNLGEVGGSEFLLAGNVPYYITTPILFHALEPPRPARAVYLVQREVAERIAAPPGSRTYGALSVNVQAVARAELVARVPAGAFRPRPAVDSAIVRLTPRPDPVVDQSLEAGFRSLVQDAFGLRRKQMRRVVRTIAHLGVDAADQVLAAAAIGPEVRPETLSPEDFARLLRAIDAVSGRGS